MSKETKRERFIRLVEKRVDKVLDKLRVLGGCSNRQLYEYTPKDIEQIRKAIVEELNRVVEQFSDKEAFTLDSVTKEEEK